jgi:hypothetical protein
MCFSNPKNSKKIALEGHKRLENYPQILHQLYELKIWIYWKLFSDNLGPNNLLYCCSFAKLYLFLLLYILNFVTIFIYLMIWKIVVDEFEK